MINAERLRSLLHYDATTGAFKWLVSAGSRRAGTVVVPAPASRYPQVRIDRRLYHAHRLAWLWMIGAWPAHEIDHVNNNPKDNRWSNLRAATHSQNGKNQVRPKNNTSGYKGVVLCKATPKNRRARDRWVPQIKIDGMNIRLGYFHCPEHAANVYHAAALHYFGEFARVDPSYRDAMGLPRMYTVPQERAMRNLADLSMYASAI